VDGFVAAFDDAGLDGLFDNDEPVPGGAPAIRRAIST
jgi:hypothetical protein